MRRLAVSAGTELAVSAGIDVAREGGNAIDAATAATFVTWVCEPGITSIGGGGFVTVWPEAAPPVVYDGFVEVPGRSAPAEAFGRGEIVEMTYGGRMTTIIGPGSVGVPGGLAALARAWSRWGSLPWSRLIEPAMALARGGFPLPRVSHTYFQYSGEAIYDRTAGSKRLHRGEDGAPIDLGEMVRLADLADTLEIVAEQGASALYGGDVGHTIGRWIRAEGGLLGPDDMAAYEVVERPGLQRRIGEWEIATNPRPAIGGGLLLALSERLGEVTAWDAPRVADFADAMHEIFKARDYLLHQKPVDGQDPVASLLSGPPPGDSGSTSHTSTVDNTGLACAVTTSTGFGSGMTVPGTGIMLNNMLGEIELQPQGYHRLPPGTRLSSNMAPTIARGPGGVLSIGAAGSSRIASALTQTWLNVAGLGLDLETAIAAPRCHLEWRDGAPVLAHEPGLDVSEVRHGLRPFEEAHMFFGGVQAARLDESGDLTASGDPRREGAGGVC